MKMRKSVAIKPKYYTSERKIYVDFISHASRITFQLINLTHFV